MLKYLLSLCFIPFLFLGCNKNSPEYSVREYKDVSKDAILNAAKRVIKLSDNDFTISSKRESLSAIRAIPKNKGFTVDININELELITVTKNEYTTATLKITQKDDIFSKNQVNLTSKLQNLFWDRIDFILGIKKSWHTCLEHRLLLNFDGFFCDMKYNNNQFPTSNDIIKDTSIPKPIAIVEDLAAPIVIDLSSMDGIILPLVISQQDAIVKLADINLTVMSDINISMPVFEKIETNITDSNISTNIIPTENNETNNTIEPIFVPQITIPSNINTNGNVDKNETNATIISPDINTTQTSNFIETTHDLNSTVIIDDNTSLILEETNKLEPINKVAIDTNTTNLAIANDNNETNNQIKEVSTSLPTTPESQPIATTPLSLFMDLNTTTPVLTQEVKQSPTLNYSKNKLSNLTGFAKKFMEADPKNDYTINLALAYSKTESNEFLKKYAIEKESFPIAFLREDGKYFIKIMYGVYKTRQEALNAITKFPQGLKNSSPTVEGVHRKQILFTTRGEDLSVK